MRAFNDEFWCPFCFTRLSNVVNNSKTAIFHMIDHIDDWRWRCGKCRLLAPKEDGRMFDDERKHGCSGFTLVKEYFTKRDIIEFGEREQVPRSMIEDAFSEFFARRRPTKPKVPYNRKRKNGDDYSWNYSNRRRCENIPIALEKDQDKRRVEHKTRDVPVQKKKNIQKTDLRLKINNSVEVVSQKQQNQETSKASTEQDRDAHHEQIPRITNITVITPPPKCPENDALMDLAVGVEKPIVIPTPPKSNESWLDRPVIPIEQSDFSRHDESPIERNVFSQVQSMIEDEPKIQRVKVQEVRADQVKHLHLGSDMEPYLSDQRNQNQVNGELIEALATKLRPERQRTETSESEPQNSQVKTQVPKLMTQESTQEPFLTSSNEVSPKKMKVLTSTETSETSKPPEQKVRKARKTKAETKSKKQEKTSEKAEENDWMNKGGSIEGARQTFSSEKIRKSCYVGYVNPYIQGFQRIDMVDYILFPVLSKKTGQFVLLAFPENLCSPGDCLKAFPEFKSYKSQIDPEILSCSKMEKYLTPSPVLTTLLRPISTDKVISDPAQVVASQVDSEVLTIPRMEPPKLN